MNNIISSRTIYLNSEENSAGDSRRIDVNIPTALLNYTATSKLRVVLNSFSAAKTWYTINNFNGIFFIGRTNDDKLFPVEINFANYTELSQLESVLSTNIKNVLDNEFTYTGTVTVKYNGNPVDYKNKFEITLSIAVPNIKFVSFSVRNEFNANNPLQAELQNKVIGPSKYNDADEILGGRVNRRTSNLSNVSELIDLFEIKTPDTVFESYYPCNLQTNDALYLRISSLPTNNIESTNLSAISNDSTSLISSDIFAKILLPNDLTTNFIDFLNPNDNFSIDISGSQLTELKFVLTDSKNRPIPLVSPTEARDGSISYSLSLIIKELSTF